MGLDVRESETRAVAVLDVALAWYLVRSDSMTVSMIPKLIMDRCTIRRTLPYLKSGTNPLVRDGTFTDDLT